MSDSSLRFDRRSKLPLYARAAVPQVWIVDIAGGCVEVYRRPDEALHAYLEQVMRRDQERLVPPGYDGAGVTVARVFGDWST